MRLRPFFSILAAIGLLSLAASSRADQTISYPPSHPTVRFSLADGWVYTQGKDASERLSAHANSSPQAEIFVSMSAGTYPDEAGCVAGLRKAVTSDTAGPGYSGVEFGASGTKSFGTIQMHYLLYRYKYNGDAFTGIYSAFTAPGGKETYYFNRRANDRDGDRYANDFKLLNTTLQPIK